MFSSLIKETNNFYLISAPLQEVISKLNLSEDIKQFILSLPDKEKSLVLSKIKKNPSITIEELQDIKQNVEEDQIDLLESEKIKISNLPDDLRLWAEKLLPKLRKFKPLPKNYQQDNKYLFYTSLMYKINEIKDWFLDQKPEISGFTAEQAIKASNDWHIAVAQKGAGKIYMEGTANVVYGPQWKNEKFSGWTVRKITSQNDLLVEGNKMHHCVSSFWEEVQDGDVEVFSLRDPRNIPHCTIGASSNGFFEVKGVNNTNPTDEIKPALKEFFESIPGASCSDIDISDVVNNLNLEEENPINYFGLKINAVENITEAKELIYEIFNNFIGRSIANYVIYDFVKNLKKQFKNNSFFNEYIRKINDDYYFQDLWDYFDNKLGTGIFNSYLEDEENAKIWETDTDPFYEYKSEQFNEWVVTNPGYVFINLLKIL